MTITHQYSIRVHYCLQSMSNSKDSTMVELSTNHLLNYSICSVNTCSHTVNSDDVLTYIRSTFAVASSITRILFPLNSALARHINCRWPTLKLEPPSDTSASNPLSILDMTCFSWTLFNGRDNESYQKPTEYCTSICSYLYGLRCT